MIVALLSLFGLDALLARLIRPRVTPRFASA